MLVDISAADCTAILLYMQHLLLSRAVYHAICLNPSMSITTLAARLFTMISAPELFCVPKETIERIGFCHTNIAGPLKI